MPRKYSALFETLAGPSQKYRTSIPILIACIGIANGAVGFYLLSEHMGEKLSPKEREGMKRFQRVFHHPTDEERAKVVDLAKRLAKYDPKPGPLTWGGQRLEEPMTNRDIEIVRAFLTADARYHGQRPEDHKALQAFERILEATSSPAPEDRVIPRPRRTG